MAGCAFSQAHIDVYEDAIGHLMSIFECKEMHSVETLLTLFDGWECTSP